MKSHTITRDGIRIGGQRRQEIEYFEAQADYTRWAQLRSWGRSFIEAVLFVAMLAVLMLLFAAVSSVING